MKSHLIKQKLAAVLCALMTVSCAVPAALAEQYDTSAAQSGAITFEPFSLHVRQAEGGLSATVDGASAYEVEVTVRSAATGASVRKALPMGNGTVSFSLEPGEYAVTAQYVSDAYAQSRTITLAAGDDAPKADTPADGHSVESAVQSQPTGGDESTGAAQIVPIV